MAKFKLIACTTFAMLLGANAASAQTAPATPLVAGTVKKIDTEQGKVTLTHDKVPNLDMDAMSTGMVWRVKDPDMLKGLKAGDKVKFTADRVDGSLTVTSIKK